MKVIHFTLRPRAPAATPFRGDILIGHMLWQFAFRHGAQALEDLLVRVPEDPPAMSDLYPDGMLPAPMLPLRKEDVPEDLRKKVKRLRYVPTASWETLRRGLTRRKLAVELVKLAMTERPDAMREEVAELHATLDRLTGTTPTGGGLYARPVTHYGRKHNTDGGQIEIELDTLHGYLAPGVFEDEAVELLDKVGEYGYGADSSTGLGVFDVPSHELVEWPIPGAANAWMSLSHHLPDPHTKAKGSCYGIETHYGRLGGSFANHGNPFKHPLLLCTTGSIWRGVPQGLPGAMLERVVDRPENIRHLGYTIPYYFCWEEE